MRVSLDDLMKGNIGSQEVSNEPIEGPLGDFLGGITPIHDDGLSNPEQHPHYRLAVRVQELMGGELKDYLKMYDRDLTDLYVKGKKMKIQDFRNKVNNYYSRYQATPNLSLGYIKNLVDEFGKIECKTQPYTFSIYKKGDNVVYESLGNESVLDDSNSESTLNMIYTFRDDLIIEGV